MQFDYPAILATLLTPEIVRDLSAIHEYRGRQVRLSRVSPEALDGLMEIALIQSTGASNRIENISTSDARLHELLLEDAAPRNRDEQEILGYRYVLDLIHNSHDDIPVTPGVILQLHRDLYRYMDVSFGGHWKDSDNIIQEIGADGQRRTRFTPTSAAATPSAMEELCGVYREQVREGMFDPLLLVIVFVFDFVCIHPFNDGNGRMSRLLTLLLMYQNGHAVGKYISIEQEIERTKRSYYEALAESSTGWQDRTNDYRPFVRYMLGVVLACCREFDERASIVDSSMSSEQRVKAYFSQQLGAISKRELLEALPVLNHRSVERTLQKLQKDGFIERVGSGRATKYRRRV